MGAGKTNMLTEQDMQEIVDRIVEVADPEKIILFGSYANGTATEDSDVDLLVVRNTAERFYRRHVPIRLALMDFDSPFDILVQTPEEFNTAKNVSWTVQSDIERTGRLVYERAS